MTARWPSVEWPGSEWPGYFTRTRLHHVEANNSERLSTGLGLANCGAVCVRPRKGGDYSWCAPCPKCFPNVE